MKQDAEITFDLECPTRQTLEVLSHKWVPGLIYMLSSGPQRPGELSRQLEGISKKMLTQTLRNLEEWGLVVRVVHEVLPPRVEYSLTPLGRKFVEPLSILRGWAVANRADVSDVHGRLNSPLPK